MTGIIPVPSTRVSDQLIHQRLLSELQFNQLELLRYQNQISTGRRITVPSHDATASIRSISLQRLIERKSQAASSLNTGRSFIFATENELSSTGELLSSIRGEALTALNSTTSNDQLRGIAEEVQRAIESLVNIGNHKFRDRFLFAGPQARVRPFEYDGAFVSYHGTEGALRSYIDIDSLAQTNSTGDEVFGAVSAPVQGTVDLNPSLTLNTKLDDLNAGFGMTRGIVLVSDATTSSTVDFQSAETIQDVVHLLESNPPDGRAITARITNNALVIDLDDSGSGNLTITEVGGGTTAAELGILETIGTGTGPLTGEDLNPRLTLTTSLDEILGTRANGLILSTGNNNDLVVRSHQPGTEFNDVSIGFIDSGTVTQGNEVVAYDDSDPLNKKLIIDVDAGKTTANDIIAAVAADATVSALFEVDLDGKDTGLPTDAGKGAVELGSETVTANGSGVQLDQASGIQIVNRNRMFVVDFQGAETVEDLLNALSGSDAGVLAQINADGTGINVRSRISGTNFHIGENGGHTATQLGIRSHTQNTSLGELDFGRGVTTVDGTDFIIRRNDGVDLEIDVSSAATVGDVLELINSHPDNQDPLTTIVARLATFGNGIELVDDDPVGAESLVVLRSSTSQAAIQLGLIPPGLDQTTAAELRPANPAVATVSFTAPNNVNNGFIITASQAGQSLNGMEVVITGGLSGNVAAVNFDAGSQQLIIQVDTSQTTANVVVAEIVNEGTFQAVLDNGNDPTNNGTGLIAETGLLATTTGGTAEILTGTDTHTLEVRGVFNTLIRLQDALLAQNTVEIERAIQLLDEDLDRLAFSRAELGARQQALDVMQPRLEDEEVELRRVLSDEIDVDLVEAISNLTARQAAFEATLRVIAQTFQLSLLDFL